MWARLAVQGQVSPKKSGGWLHVWGLEGVKWLCAEEGTRTSGALDGNEGSECQAGLRLWIRP